VAFAKCSNHHKPPTPVENFETKPKINQNKSKWEGKWVRRSAVKTHQSSKAGVMMIDVPSAAVPTNGA
jgi:hypothetical protein